MSADMSSQETHLPSFGLTWEVLFSTSLSETIQGLDYILYYIILPTDENAALIRLLSRVYIIHRGHFSVSYSQQ